MTKSVATLRVAYIITGLGTGGAESMLEKLIAALPAACLVQVTSLTDMGEIGLRLRSRGVDVEALGMERGLPSPQLIYRLVRRLQGFAPSIIHTWMYHANLLGGLAAWWTGHRALMWGLRQSNLSAAVNRRSTLYVNRVCAWLSHRLPSRIACAGEAARQAHVAAGYAADRMVVLPNGFDLSRFSPDWSARLTVRRELGWPVETPLVGMIGRFDVQKNHRGFVRAMRRLVDLRPNVRFVFAGQGVDMHNQALLSWLSAAGVAGCCALLGPRSDVPRLMAALDVLALPSIGEAFPNVVGEAMACGIPCAATNVGDVQEIVGSCGHVVDSGDMDALANALDDLLGMPAERREAMSKAAVERIGTHFDIHAVARAYEAEYRTMMDAQAGAL